MKNLKVISVIAVVLICVLFLIIVPMVRNNVLLWKYANQLYTIPLPPDTKLISKNESIGNLYGTGNHLDFTSAIEIKSLLTEEELADYYGVKTGIIKSVDELSIIGLNTSYYDMNIDHSQTIEVIPKAQARLYNGSSTIFYKSDVINDSIDENLFIIQIKDTHYAPDWDLRSH